MKEQRGSLTISLNLAQSCPFQFTHLQNGNNNKHLRENIHMSSLRPLMFISPEAQQREAASNSDALNGLLMELAPLLAAREIKFSAPAPLHLVWGGMPEDRHCEHPLSCLILQPLPRSASLWWSSVWVTQWFSTSAKWSELWDEHHAEPHWGESLRVKKWAFQQHFVCVKPSGSTMNYQYSQSLVFIRAQSKLLRLKSSCCSLWVAIVWHWASHFSCPHFSLSLGPLHHPWVWCEP